MVRLVYHRWVLVRSRRAAYVISWGEGESSDGLNILEILLDLHDILAPLNCSLLYSDLWLPYYIQISGSHHQSTWSQSFVSKFDVFKDCSLLATSMQDIHRKFQGLPLGTLSPLTLHEELAALYRQAPSCQDQNGHRPKLRVGVLQGVYIVPDAHPNLRVLRPSGISGCF